MTNLCSLARPYALALFGAVRDDKDQLGALQIILKSLAAVAEDPQVTSWISDTRISPINLAEFFLQVLTQYKDVSVFNILSRFVMVLKDNKRFILLPEIAKQFDEYVKRLMRSRVARVVTAVPMDANQKEQLREKLSERLQQQVELQCEIDERILGGAVIYLGNDHVIDGSVQRKLTRLLEFSLR